MFELSEPPLRSAPQKHPSADLFVPRLRMQVFDDEGQPARLRPEAGPRERAVLAAARFYGMELDPADLRRKPGETSPSAAALGAWVRTSGLWARAVRLSWRHLTRLSGAGPVVLLFADGAAAVVTGFDRTQDAVLLKNPGAPGEAPPVAVDRYRLARFWAGEAVLLRARRGVGEAAAPLSVAWLLGLVMRERRSMRDVGIASLTLSLLTIFPPLLTMTVVDRVLAHHSLSTLELLAAILAICMLHEALLGHARRTIVLVVGTRIDTRLGLHVFERLLRLPLDYFEHHPAGETLYRIGQVQKVREFLTGRLLVTFLDLFTLAVMVPLLFYLDPTLSWIVIGCAGLILLVVLAALKPLRAAYAKVVAAETRKAAVLSETILGIRTVKAMGGEPHRTELWDLGIAEAGRARLAFGRLANWPQTVTAPLERVMSTGIMVIGAWLALEQAGALVGALFAFMMLSTRLAQPLVGLARLIEDYESFRVAIGEAASVLNQPAEDSAAAGARPRIAGAISFEEVSFTYHGAGAPALDRVSFSISAGTKLGVVGRSGSGKSTLGRLLQGLNRDYAGLLKLDGTELREINLRHLRTSLGIVLQDNFLFRGSIRDNIVAGRPNLTLDDVIAAARLAGAEEFIERLPGGYDTLVEEGCPNLSGGQRQRLAIARALITDPKVLILDEATNALDPESEALVNANLQRIAEGRTMLIISHRLSTLTHCDEIAVLEAGAVVDIGPHHVLLDRCPQYRQLWFQQTHHLDQGSRHVASAPTLVAGL